MTLWGLESSFWQIANQALFYLAGSDTILARSATWKVLGNIGVSASAHQGSRTISAMAGGLWFGMGRASVCLEFIYA